MTWPAPGSADGLKTALRIALFEPDIPQNTGAVLRLGACFGIPVDIIEPCGFAWSDRRLRRAGMDYIEAVELTRHASWAAYTASPQRAQGRLLLLTTAGETPYTTFAFRGGDTLLLGRESSGAPESVHAAADARLVIPLRAPMRALNLAMAAAIALAEALRQTGGLPQQSAGHPTRLVLPQPE